MDDFKFEIREKIGELSSNGKGWAKELNYVSWNDREPKLDIRDWSEDHTKMSKGVSFTKEEIVALKELLNSLKL